jgi:hypothetical protein
MSLSLTSLCTASSTDLSKSSNLSFSPPNHRSLKAGNDIVLQALIHGPVPVREDTLLHVPPKNFNWLSNLVNAKKLRLVKRLKNRIETKTGHKIFSNLVSGDSQFNPRKNVCRRSLSTKTTKIVSKAETRAGQSRNVDNLNVNFLSNRSVCINIDVEPAYF